MRRFQLAPILLLLTISSWGQTPAASKVDDSRPAEPPVAKSFDPSIIDKSADPCTDFYQYACGNWNKNNPIPADQVDWARSFSLIEERNRYLLWQELDAAARDPQSPLQKQYGDFFGACMDTAAIDARGASPLKPAFDRIGALAGADQFPTLMADLENHGVPDGFFNFSVAQDQKDSSKQIVNIYQGGISLPDRDYYIDDSPHYAEIRKQYVAHMVKMFVLAGDTQEQAAKEAAAAMKIETALAKASMDRTLLRDPANRYHIYTLADFGKLAPNFEWRTYFDKSGIAHFDSLNVATPDFFKALNGLIQSEPLDSWKSYLRWQALHGQASNLATPIFNEDFAFFSHTLEGQEQPRARWKRCSSATDDALGEAVGQDWVKKNFPPAAKESMDKLVAALEKALGEDIQTLSWMSDATKKAAEEKLALIRNKIGYPDKWRDYSGLKVDRTDFLGNEERSAVFERDWNFGHLGKPVDEKEWGMTPPTVNAYYNDPMNDINFPAGILQPPFFDVKADQAVNFGGIGMVIGHEMTHGFDDEGSKYDGHGNVREWQTPEDRKAFTERTDCVAKEYSGFEVAPAHGDIKAQLINGKLTLGENTADNGGLRIAYMALVDTLAAQGRSITDVHSGFTEAQLYFLGFGQAWCANSTEQFNREMAVANPHALEKWRVNGTIPNFDEFGKAFGCKKGQPMYPAKSCRVW
jgi:putative endopeptidase